MLSGNVDPFLDTFRSVLDALRVVPAIYLSKSFASMTEKALHQTRKSRSTTSIVDPDPVPDTTYLSKIYRNLREVV